MEWIGALIWLIILQWIIVKSPLFATAETGKKWLPFLFMVKVGASILLWWMYTYYYPDRVKADIYRYFDDGRALYDLFFHDQPAFWGNFLGYRDDFAVGGTYYDNMNFWVLSLDVSGYNDNRVMIRLNAFFHFISGHHPITHGILFCFLSFTGLWWMAKGLAHLFKFKLFPFFGLLVCFPSILLWSSGGLKEAVLIFGMGLAMAGLLHQFLSPIANWTAALLGIVLVGFTKWYVLPAVIPGILVYVTCTQRSLWKPALWRWGLVMGSGFAILCLMHYTGFGIDFFEKIAVKRHHFIRLSIFEHARSLVFIDDIAPTPLAFLKEAPLAFWNTLSRPYVWEIRQIPQLLAALENIVCIIWLTIALLHIRKNHTPAALLLTASFIIILYTLIGLSTPVSGGMVRYKVPALPFFAALLWSLAPIHIPRWRLRKPFA